VMTAVRSLGKGLSAFIGLLPSGREDGQVAQPPWQANSGPARAIRRPTIFPRMGCAGHRRASHHLRPVGPSHMPSSPTRCAVAKQARDRGAHPFQRSAVGIGGGAIDQYGMPAGNSHPAEPLRHREARVAGDPIRSSRSPRSPAPSPYTAPSSGSSLPVPASSRSRTNQAGLSMTLQEVMLVMRCHPVHGRRVRSERNYEWRSRWSSPVVGLGGLEPPASSSGENALRSRPASTWDPVRRLLAPG
jgi:hypothetical protein